MNQRITIEVSTACPPPPVKDSITQQAEARWNSDPDLRAEFSDNLSSYIAYERANASGRVKTLPSRVQTHQRPAGAGGVK